MRAVLASEHWLHGVGEQLHRELIQNFDRAVDEDEQAKELALQALELTDLLDERD